MRCIVSVLTLINAVHTCIDSNFRIATFNFPLSEKAMGRFVPIIIEAIVYSRCSRLAKLRQNILTLQAVGAGGSH